MSPHPLLRILLQAHAQHLTARVAGTVGGSASQSGSRFSTVASVSDMSSPSNARLPVSISNSTQPNAQMSARLSTVFPRACSGDMYAAVPRIMPACVIAGVVIVGDIDEIRRRARPTGSIAFARPKSSTFTVPSARTLMFAGFRSRWMIPCSCAASSASAICFAIGNASSSGIAPRAIRCDRSSPSTSSITSAVMPPRFFEAVDARRCSDDSARRASSLRAGSARGGRGRRRTRRGRILIATCALQLRVASPDRPAPCRLRRSAR